MAFFLAGIPTWNDADIMLYHGTVGIYVASILQRIDLSLSQPLRDFGKGFYTTTNQLQAELRARERAKQLGDVPAVIAFAVERNTLAQLDSLCFVRSSPAATDYWSFVQNCRNTGRHDRRHAIMYDLVVGPVTGDWKKQTAIPDGDQISFHTDRAVYVLDVLAGARKRQVT
ncbi:MAG: DUF3990 domain-containing protein [Gemmataceae bacterium]